MSWAICSPISITWCMIYDQKQFIILSFGVLRKHDKAVFGRALCPWAPPPEPEPKIGAANCALPPHAKRAPAPPPNVQKRSSRRHLVRLLWFQCWSCWRSRSATKQAHPKIVEKLKIYEKSLRDEKLYISTSKSET